MLRRLGGRSWTPRSIDFRHAAPADLAVHRRLLGAPLRFGQPSTRILLSPADLDRPVRDADRQRLPVVERHLSDILSDPGDADPWRHALELQIASLVCDGHPGLRSVAPRLGMSVRTLQRRLDERGIRYRDLVAQVRMRMAHHYLREHGLGLGEIGLLLGYSEPSAFDRAFRRWTGTTPGAYRRSAQIDSPASASASRS
jgi:AraC-like DNA-binding protein